MPHGAAAEKCKFILDKISILNLPLLRGSLPQINVFDCLQNIIVISLVLEATNPALQRSLRIPLQLQVLELFIIPITLNHILVPHSIIHQ